MLHAPCHWADSPVPVEAQNGLHFLVAQHKVKNLEILLNTCGGDRLGNHNRVPLNMEADQDLCRGLLVLLSDGLDVGIIQQRRVLWFGPWSVWGTQGAVGCHRDALRVTVVDQLLLVQVRVAFNLVVGRFILEAWLV